MSTNAYRYEGVYRNVWVLAQAKVGGGIICKKCSIMNFRECMQNLEWESKKSKKVGVGIFDMSFVLICRHTWDALNQNQPIIINLYLLIPMIV